MTRRERLLASLERRKAWAGSRKKKSAAAFDSARKATEGIPFGQPILVGHHSESAHRNAIRKSHNAMRKGIEHDEMASHHKSKARGIERQLAGSVFSDDPDALEKLKGRVGYLEEQREMIKLFNKKGDTEMLSNSLREHLAMCVNARQCNGKRFPSYVLSNIGQEINRNKKRIASIESQQRNSAAARKNGGVVIKMTDTGTGSFCEIVFAEKPERGILNELKSNGFRWGRGSWSKAYCSMDDIPTQLHKFYGDNSNP
jgi:hypothetical protein